MHIAILLLSNSEYEVTHARKGGPITNPTRSQTPEGLQPTQTFHFSLLNLLFSGFSFSSCGFLFVWLVVFLFLHYNLSLNLTLSPSGGRNFKLLICIYQDYKEAKLMSSMHPSIHPFIHPSVHPSIFSIYSFIYQTFI